MRPAPASSSAVTGDGLGQASSTPVAGDGLEPHAGDEIVVLAPLRLEARAVRSGAPWADVRRTGMGARRAARAARSLIADGDRPILIAGFCGALDPALTPGDVVLASELRGPAGTFPCEDPSILAGVLRRGGLRALIAPVASSRRLVLGERRRALHRTGVVAVDMESAWLAPAARRRPLVTLRVVLDTSRRELYRPLRTLAGAASAYRALRHACSLTEEWGRALGSRELVLPGGAPGAHGHATDDHATSHPQQAVRALAEECDLILVAGSVNSPAVRQLVEVAEQAGCRATVAQDAADIRPAALSRARRIGLAADAPASEASVQAMIRALGGLGEVTVSQGRIASGANRTRLSPEAMREGQ